MAPETRVKTSRPHVMVFPFPAQGHLLPLLDLTHQLCLRGVTVSVVITPGNLQYLSPLLSAHPSSVTPVVFPFPPHPSLPPGVENVKDLGNSGNLPIMSSLRQLRDPIILWFRSHKNPPVALVSDFFLGWTHDLCRQIGIPRFAFFSSGAFLASVLQFCFDNIKSRTVDPVCFSDLPRAPVFEEKHLPSVFRRSLQSPSKDLETLKADISMNFSSYGCVFNTAECLEAEYVEYVKQRVGHDRVFGVGPLCLLGLDPVGTVKSSSCPLLSWLHGCPKRSVLYICFGSQKALTKEQCDALALGLEKSMTRFVWVVKKDPVPEGFEDRVAGWGMVVRGWAPQLEVLRHVAVGGFLSHCGWNSVLEGLTSGTMVLGWPMEADQFVNARLLVEDLDVAVRVCEGDGTVPDPDQLGRVIGETMCEGGREVRDRAGEIQRKLVGSVRGGSSFADLERLVQELALL